ncbi:MAG: hypothetical protein PHW96_00595 [Candidatus Nanoarchaeia archaeon]|nr:hypothetical protein [Candidatus Nanoarchaeia archaeon]
MDKEVLLLKKKMGENLIAVLKNKKKTILLINDMLVPKDEELKFRIDMSKLAGKHEVILLNSLWEQMSKGEKSLLNTIASSKSIHDEGTYEIIKTAKKLTENVVDKFGEHVVCAVLYGSAVMGRATTDIDIAFIVNDTDLKDMTRSEAREKLSAIINSIAIGSSSKRKPHVQVYMLSSFWESVRDANPVIFTLIRDGVPFHDIGLFMPWKNLLKMGKIKPSVEAIDNFLLSANIFIKKLKDQITDMTIDDLWYVMINPAQASLMMYGMAPANHKETINLVNRILVKKEKILEKKYYIWLKDIFEARKRFEHDEKTVSASELAKYMKKADEYLERMSKLFDEVREKKFKHDIVSIETNLKKNVEKAITSMGIKKGKRKLMDAFKEEIIKEGVLPKTYLASIEYFYKIKEDYRSGKITSEEIRKARNEVESLISELRKFMKEKQKDRTEALKIKFKHGEQMGYMWIVGKKAFIVKDSKKPNEVYSAKINKTGKFTDIKQTGREDMQNAMEKTKIVEEAFIKEKTFESLKKMFDGSVEFLLGE